MPRKRHGLEKIDDPLLAILHVADEDDAVFLLFYALYRVKNSRIHAVVDHAYVILVDPERLVDLERCVMRNRNDPVHPVGHDFLHQERIVENPLHFKIKRGWVLEPGRTVDGKGVMDRGDEWDPQPLDEKEAVSKALVVMDYIKPVCFEQLFQLQKGPY